MKHRLQRLTNHLLTHLSLGDELAARRLEGLYALHGPSLGWWRELAVAVFSLGARYPVRTGANFGVGLVLRMVLGYPTAYALNRINLWVTPAVPLSWLDFHVHWTWALVVLGRGVLPHRVGGIAPRS